MHACLLPKTEKVLYWGYGDTRDDISRIWDYSTPAGSFSAPANQPFDVTSPLHNRGLANLWSAEHAFLDTPQGTLLIHGGFTPREAYLFDPVTLMWSRVAPTTEQRFYSTTLTLANGKALTILGAHRHQSPQSRLRYTIPAPAHGTRRLHCRLLLTTCTIPGPICWPMVICSSPGLAELRDALTP